MSLLSEAERQRVAEMLVPMTRPVRIVFATQTFGCDTCDDARRIFEEVCDLHERLSMDQLNLVLDSERAAAYGIDVAPAAAIVAIQEDGTEWDPGIRFYGTPSGYEFMSLLEAILIVSGGDSGLSEASREKIAAVTEPLRIQVFVTPT
jgi:alkyl hydroperoxide reductase subunit AhpF